MENSGVGKIPLLDIEMNLKDHPKFLWAIVAISTACFVVSAVLLYLSRKQILDIVEKYYARSLEQVGLLSLRVPDPACACRDPDIYGPWGRGPNHGLPARHADVDDFRQRNHRCARRLGGRRLPLQNRSTPHAADYCFGTLGGVIPLSADHSSGEDCQGRGEGFRGVEG